MIQRYVARQSPWTPHLRAPRLPEPPDASETVERKVDVHPAIASIRKLPHGLRAADAKRGREHRWWPKQESRMLNGIQPTIRHEIPAVESQKYAVKSLRARSPVPRLGSFEACYVVNCAARDHSAAYFGDPGIGQMPGDARRFRSETGRSNYPYHFRVQNQSIFGTTVLSGVCGHNFCSY